MWLTFLSGCQREGFFHDSSSSELARTKKRALDARAQDANCQRDSQQRTLEMALLVRKEKLSHNREIYLLLRLND